MWNTNTILCSEESAVPNAPACVRKERAGSEGWIAMISVILTEQGSNPGTGKTSPLLFLLIKYEWNRKRDEKVILLVKGFCFSRRNFYVKVEKTQRPRFSVHVLGRSTGGG